MRLILVILLALAGPCCCHWASKQNVPGADTENGCAEAVDHDRIVFIAHGSTSAYLYTVSTNAWTDISPQPTTSNHPTCSSISNSAVIVTFGNNARKYDAINDIWSSLASLPISTTGHASVSNGATKVFVLGGQMSTGPISSSLFEYSAASDTWTEKTPMPTADHQMSAAFSDGNIVVMGGSSNGVSVRKYNVLTDAWMTMLPLPVGRNIGEVAVGIGTMVLIGGDVSGGKDLHSYDFTSDTWWTAMDSSPSSHAGGASAILPNGDVYFFGSSTNIVEVFSSPSIPLVPVSHVAAANIPALGGSSLTVSGSWFGVADLTPTSRCPDIAPTTRWLSITSLVVLTPASTKTSFAWHIDKPSSTFTYMTLDAPALTSLTSVNAPSPGQSSMTVHGINFGSSAFGLSVAVGSTLCATTSWTSTTGLMCRVGPGSGAQRRVVLEASSLVGTLARAFSFDAPVVTRCVHADVNSPATASTVTVEGVNFGTTDGSPTVSANTLCVSTQWISRTALQCGVSSGLTNANVVVEVDGLVGTNTVLFSFTFDGTQ